MLGHRPPPDRGRCPPTSRAACAPTRCAAALAARADGPAIVCAQAGNVNTGAFDPLAEIVAAAARRAAPGCTSTAPSACGRRSSPASATSLAGVEARRLLGDRRPQVAERPLRLGHRDRPRPRGAPRAPCRHRAAYLVPRSGEPARGQDWAPESRAGPAPSRCTRRCARWAARGAGRPGRPLLRPRPAAWPTAWRRGGGRVLNDVVLNQVLRPLRAATSDELTRRRSIERVQRGRHAAGSAGSTFRGRSVIRISVVGWQTTTEDIDRSADAISPPCAL